MCVCICYTYVSVTTRRTKTKASRAHLRPHKRPQNSTIPETLLDICLARLNFCWCWRWCELKFGWRQPKSTCTYIQTVGVLYLEYAYSSTCTICETDCSNISIFAWAALSSKFLMCLRSEELAYGITFIRKYTPHTHTHTYIHIYIYICYTHFCWSEIDISLCVRYLYIYDFCLYRWRNEDYVSGDAGWTI